MAFDFGWIDAPEAREETRVLAGFKPLGSIIALGSFPGMVVGAQDIMLYKAWKDVLGDYPPYPAQQIGDCTSKGFGHGNDLAQCIVIALSEAESIYSETCTEAVYAVGREAGNMLRGGDGCYGSAIVKGLTDIGFIPREMVGAYSGSRAKQWGREGLPSALKAKAAEFKLGSAALITTLDELDVALLAGCPVGICSNQGFEGNGGFRRDQDGFCHAGGTWPHCMLIAGKISSDGKPSYVIAQSWGDKNPDGPRPFDLPAFCFRAKASVVQSILAAQDSYALNKGVLFRPLPLPRSWRHSGWA